MFTVSAFACALALAAVGGGAAYSPAAGASRTIKIKTRTEHLSGTPWVLVVSYLPSAITSITCERWTMLGANSWNHQNDFTIPAGPAVAIMDASHFEGYCKEEDSIKAHTDDGDFVGVLDRGAGNWKDSTQLTFNAR